MFIIFLRFTGDKARAPQFMEAHNAWLRQGFDDGVFLLAGGLEAGRGGAILAHGTDAPAIMARVATDPFVIEGIVSPDIQAITPGRVDDRLSFLRAA
ncbi:YciI family protein [Niveispirillum fermenti]|uniref:YciI family protein n=1 Tax=Niveispirillum fermenti TaxID=1233113 RepID=UPI003A8A6E95